MTAVAYPDILLHDLVKQYRLQPVVDVNAAPPVAPDAAPVEVPLDVVVAQRPAFLERLPAKDRGALERLYSAVQAENVCRTRSLSRRFAGYNRSPNGGRLRLVSAFLRASAEHGRRLPAGGGARRARPGLCAQKVGQEPRAVGHHAFFDCPRACAFPDTVAALLRRRCIPGN